MRLRPTIALFGTFMAVLAILSVVLFHTLAESWLAWFIAGAILGGSTAFALNQVNIAAGVSQRMAGIDVQAGVTKSLKRIARSTVIPSLPLERGNIDHIVISPDGVLAVEVKWTTKSVDFNQPRKSAQLRKGLTQAKEAARKLQLLLESADWKFGVKVEPCLVIAGVKVPSVKGGALVIDGVYVVVARQDKEWATLFQRERLSDWQQEALAHALTEAKQTRETAESHS